MPRPLVGTVIESGKYVHDLVLWETSREYCRHAVTIAGPVDLEIGDVLVDPVPAPEAIPTDGYPAFGDVLCLEKLTIASGDSASIKALVRGPAVVNIDQVVKANPNETDAQLVTRLADLIAQGVRFVKEPVVQSTSDLNG